MRSESAIRSALPLGPPNVSEGKILEVTKAFRQPISIALLVDASSSMSYAMRKATQAALTFVNNTLKQGDRCVVFSEEHRIVADGRPAEVLADRRLLESVNLVACRWAGGRPCPAA